MLTFMSTCDTRGCYVTSWVGWGGGGDVNVHVNLRHTRMLRHVLGWVGWGGDVNVHVNLRHTRMLRHVLGWVGLGGWCWRSCQLATHADATSRLGLGGVGGDVNVHVNLRHTRMLRHNLGAKCSCRHARWRPLHQVCGTQAGAAEHSLCTETVQGLPSGKARCKAWRFPGHQPGQGVAVVVTNKVRRRDQQGAARVNVSPERGWLMLFLAQKGWGGVRAANNSLSPHYQNVVDALRCWRLHLTSEILLILSSWLSRFAK